MGHSKATHVKTLSASGVGGDLANASLNLYYDNPAQAVDSIICIDHILAYCSGNNAFASEFEVAVLSAGTNAHVVRLVAFPPSGEPVTISESFDEGLPIHGRVDSTTTNGITESNFNSAASLPSATSGGHPYGAIVRLYGDGGTMTNEHAFHLTVAYHFEPRSARSM